jgi:hypothetical protein
MVGAIRVSRVSETYRPSHPPRSAPGVVDEQHAGIDVDAREPAAELVADRPCVVVFRLSSRPADATPSDRSRLVTT